jgi:hypothetical protein
LKKFRSTAQEGVYRSYNREEKKKYSIGEEKEKYSIGEEKDYCCSSTAKMNSGVGIQQGREVEDIEEGVVQQ